MAIVHCTRFFNRKLYLDGKLAALNLNNVHWCTEKDLTSVDAGIRYSKNVFGLSTVILGFDIGVNARTLVKSRRVSYWEGVLLLLRFLLTRRIHLIMGSLPSDKKTMRKIDLEVQQMHMLAIKKGLESNTDWILVIEDDSIFEIADFKRVYQIAEHFNSAEPIWINLNDGAGLLRTKSDKLLNFEGLFRVKPPAVRCSSAYLVSATFAKLFLDLVNKWGLPDWLPIDYIFHVAMRRIKGVKTFWQEPPIFLQGSENGFYKSGLR
jgi:hypothetical protein